MSLLYLAQVVWPVLMAFRALVGCQNRQLSVARFSLAHCSTSQAQNSNKLSFYQKILATLLQRKISAFEPYMTCP
ncbi:hypothetical protein Y032_0625g803 [Ancylostoma ceylanicum]|uniref:Secreted protein n=1 Tax=Ancylostoma ceylanicum TaxID=53326 RepID=A0A016WK51_9BILA|nr:hypothetical protein Y032_0625g803 [Ancylostoma ceylanicum]